MKGIPVMVSGDVNWNRSGWISARVII